MGSPAVATPFTWAASPGLFFFSSPLGNTITSAPGTGGGNVVISRTDGGLFRFEGLDFTYGTLDLFLGAQSLTVNGRIGSTIVGSASFEQPLSNRGNSTSFGPGGLAGIDIETLSFTLPGRRIVFDDDGFQISGDLTFSVRNLVLDDLAVAAPVPEPATWALMIAGFALVGGSMRSRMTRRRVAICFGGARGGAR